MSLLSTIGVWINAHAVWASLPAFTYVLLALVDTHITTACVTLYLHRCQTHRSISFHPAIEHVMRTWLWVRTAMPTKEWVAVHRCHHANVDTPADPHSPIFFGIWRVVFLGTRLYHTAAHDEELVSQYGKGHARRRVGAAAVPAAQSSRAGRDARNQRLALWLLGSGHVALRDGVDSIFCRWRDQRPWTLVGLPEFRDPG